MLRASGEARYEPLSVVRHRHRRTWPELQRQAYGYSFGPMVSLFVTYARGGEPSDLLRAFVFLPLWYANRIRQAPMRWVWRSPDYLLLSSLRGYFASFRRLGLLRSSRSSASEHPDRVPAGTTQPL